LLPRRALRRHAARLRDSAELVGIGTTVAVLEAVLVAPAASLGLSAACIASPRHRINRARSAHQHALEPQSPKPESESEPESEPETESETESESESESEPEPESESDPCLEPRRQAAAPTPSWRVVSGAGRAASAATATSSVSIRRSCSRRRRRRPPRDRAGSPTIRCRRSPGGSMASIPTSPLRRHGIDEHHGGRVAGGSEAGLGRVLREADGVIFRWRGSLRSSCCRCS
jgi:hypothetical protein